MELSQLRNFVILAEHLHFRRAAAVVGVSASTLSRQISELEADLDVRLFERNRRQVVLTPAGEAFLRETQVVLHRLRFASIDARRVARGEQVRIRIGHGDSIGLVLLERALPRLRAKCPDVRLEVAEAPTTELLERLVARTLDLALVRPPVHAAGIDDVHLCDERLVVALPSGHRLAEAERVDIADLDGEPLVVPPRPGAPGAYDTIIGLFADAHVRANVVEEGSTAASLLLLVAAGLGVAITPYHSTRHFDSDNMTVRPLAGRPATLPLHVAWRGDDANEALPLLRAVLESAAADLPDPLEDGRERGQAAG